MRDKNLKTGCNATQKLDQSTHFHPPTPSTASITAALYPVRTVRTMSISYANRTMPSRSTTKRVYSPTTTRCNFSKDEMSRKEYAHRCPARATLITGKSATYHAEDERQDSVAGRETHVKNGLRTTRV
uniref:Uncharacterized protein n=1 Tax=Mycena chlorophos TaxID=658473 RepID=A0ABQ0LF60_MYCCL|nr:predicted protein [Mycena chlorophos]